MKKNLLLVLLSLVIALVLGEFVLRLVGVDRVKFREKPKISWVDVPENAWVEHHPVLGWFSQKNKSVHFKTSQFAADVRTNSAGFRGIREYALTKRPDVRRLAALGDSFVFGFGVEDNQTFPSRLEASSPGIEVLNAGVPGYGIDQIYLSYREIARKYHPDIVLIGIFPEDFWRCTRSFADSGHVKPYFSLSAHGKLVLHNVPVPPPFSLNKDQFPPLFEGNPIQNILNESVLFQLAKKPVLKLAKNLRLIDPNSSEEWLIGRAILHQMIEEVRRDGATPVLVLMPPRDWAQSTRKPSIERSIVSFAEREKVGLIDLHPLFTAAVARDGLETYYIKDDWHWTAKGHALAAKAIEEYFNRKGA